MKRYICTISSFGLSMMLASCTVDEPLGWVVNAESCVIEDIGSSQGVSTSIDLNDVDEDESIIESYRNKQLQCIDDHVKLASYHQCDWQWGTNASFSMDIAQLSEIKALNLDESAAFREYLKKKEDNKATAEYWKPICETEGLICITSFEDLANTKNDFEGTCGKDDSCKNWPPKTDVYLLNDIVVTPKELSAFKSGSLCNLKLQSIPCANNSTITFEGMDHSIFELLDNVEFERINIKIEGLSKDSQEVRLANELRCSTIDQSNISVDQATSAVFGLTRDSRITNSQFDIKTVETSTSVVSLVSDRIDHSEISSTVIRGILKNIGESCPSNDKDVEENRLGIGALSGSVKNSEIQDVVLDNVSVIASKQCIVGGLIGYAENVHITYEEENADKANEILGKNWVGGRVGYMQSGSIQGTALDRSQRHLSETYRVQGHYDVGGFVGYASSDTEIKNIKNKVDVVNGDKERVGGFVGHLYGNADNILNLIGDINKVDQASYWNDDYALECGDANNDDPGNGCLHSHALETVGIFLVGAQKQGGFAGVIDGQAIVSNIQNKIDNITGYEKIGGFAGVIEKLTSVSQSTNSVTGRLSTSGGGGAIGVNRGSLYQFNSEVNLITAKSGVGGFVGSNEHTGSLSHVNSHVEMIMGLRYVGGFMFQSDGMIDNVASNATRIMGNNQFGGFAYAVGGIVTNVSSKVGEIIGKEYACQTDKTNILCVKYPIVGKEEDVIQLCILAENLTVMSSYWVSCTNVCDNNCNAPNYPAVIGGFAAVGDIEKYGPVLRNISTQFDSLSGGYHLGGFLAEQSFYAWGKTSVAYSRQLFFENISVVGKIKSSIEPNTNAGFIGRVYNINQEYVNNNHLSLRFHLISSMVQFEYDNGIKKPDDYNSLFIGQFSEKDKNNSMDDNNFLTSVKGLLEDAFFVVKQAIESDEFYKIWGHIPSVFVYCDDLKSICSTRTDGDKNCQCKASYYNVMWNEFINKVGYIGSYGDENEGCDACKDEHSLSCAKCILNELNGGNVQQPVEWKIKTRTDGNEPFEHYLTFDLPLKILYPEFEFEVD